MKKEICVNIIDIHNRRIFKGCISIIDGIIASITECENDSDQFILPGFVDAHVHIESSMLIPSEFARLAVVHGTVGTISDPHEIANVLGVQGVEFMIQNAQKVPLKIYFGVPSCVPATIFETAGAEINAEDVKYLFEKYDLAYLAEMMNFPGVLARDPLVMEKIQIARDFGKPTDGHAPGLMGDLAEKYISAGISTDHECFTEEEALSKLQLGMKILIREGSAAKNFEALIPLAKQYSANIMFCSDDKHPDNLVEGHINTLVKRALAKGIELFDVLQMACLNPVQHYAMKVGLLRVGDPADFIVIDDPKQFNILETYIDGTLVAQNGKTNIPKVSEEPINNFNISPIHQKVLAAPASSSKIKVIEALDGQLITNSLVADAKIEDGNYVSDTENDVLKMVCVNRYSDSPVAIAFIKNFGLKHGAIASSVAHDSHNIIAVGTDDASMAKAINLIIDARGGISLSSPTHQEILPLPVGGLMSADDGYKIAERYSHIDQLAKSHGSTLKSPFMSLSFMALLVIPHLKLSDKGLFDGDTFQFTSISA